MSQVTFDITDKSHPDHMPEATLKVIKEIVRDGEAIVVVPPEAGIFIAKVKLPDHLPDLANALRGPASGEAPVGSLAKVEHEDGRVEYVGDDPAFYGTRGGRNTLSRLTRLPSQPTRYATVIVGNLRLLAASSRDTGPQTAVTQESLYGGDLFTAYGDNEPSGDTVIAPQEPGDKFADVETLAERVEFWSQHALSVDVPPSFREAAADFADYSDLNRSQIYATTLNELPEEETEEATA